MAVEYGACTRPLAVRRTGNQTGEQTIIPIRCGATLASVCPTCAEKNRRDRITQAREGWHLTEEPVIETAEPTAAQKLTLGYRADLEDARAQALAVGDTATVAELDRDIEEADALLRGEGLRGTVTRGRDKTEDGEAKKRRVRSTRRRKDAANLPRKPVAKKTIGRTFTTPDGKAFQPSTFITLTLPSYGRIYDGAAVDPDSYDYRRAVRDAIHFGGLIDRFWQNLRRAVGWNVQYFAVIEPQKRGAPHLHAAIRGTIPRKLIRQVAAATYDQIWWPPYDEPVYTGDRLPVWDETRKTPCFVDPDTHEPLMTWDAAIQRIDDGEQDEPAHVVRFGAQVDIQGVLEGSQQAGMCLGYLVKYLTKAISECHTPESSRQADHVDRLVAALEYQPCSPTCPNWLRYGIQPAKPKSGMVPGQCKGKAHKAAHLGYGGRRCLVSRKWSGKTLAEHRDDKKQHVLRTLGAVGAKPDQATPDGERQRYSWDLMGPRDPDRPDRTQLLLQVVAQKRRWREQYEQARQLLDDVSATGDQAA
ncbi:replication initiation protein [Pseudonocardia bannensis]|uniref:Replication initiation protein n=2 Tax=Pseudonocardia bannensis TaxID=630973 RepID=A0A848DL46_9PSEU|nr:replication initiation protein [Pseudonocardia bannensis]